MTKVHMAHELIMIPSGSITLGAASELCQKSLAELPVEIPPPAPGNRGGTYDQWVGGTGREYLREVALGMPERASSGHEYGTLVAPANPWTLLAVDVHLGTRRFRGAGNPLHWSIRTLGRLARRSAALHPQRPKGPYVHRGRKRNRAVVSNRATVPEEGSSRRIDWREVQSQFKHCHYSVVMWCTRCTMKIDLGDDPKCVALDLNTDLG
jgi:hypothetical protein